MGNRSWVLERMKSKAITISEFNFEQLQAPPISYFLTPLDIEQLRKLATSLRYSGKPKQKMDMMDKIMESRGFRKITGGTNRVVYKHLEVESIVVKVAIDKVGMSDNPAEFKNQFIFKPFVTKVFEVTPCGTVGLFERVVPITSRKMFASVASDVYDMLRLWFLGEYVLGDIGTKCFLNFGIREGFGPVLLDFPYVYKLDGEKLFCNRPTPDGEFCGGVIDYDAGFNGLYCTKCGAMYKAKELEEAIKDQSVIVESKEDSKMVVSGYYGDDLVVTGLEKYSPMKEVSAIRRRKHKPKSQKIGEMTVSVKGNEIKIKDAEEAREEKHTMKVEAIRYSVNNVETAVNETPAVNVPEEEKPVHEIAAVGVRVPINEDNDVETTEDPQEEVASSLTKEDESTEDQNGESVYSDDLSKFSGLPVGKDDSPVCYLKAQSTTMKEILEDCDDETEVICLTTDDGTMWVCDTNEKNYVIESIDGVNCNDLAIITKELYDELIKVIADYKKDNANLLAKVEELEGKNEELTKAFSNMLDKPSEPDSNPAPKRDAKGRFTKSSDNKHGKKPSNNVKDDIPDQVKMPVGAAPKK